MDWQAGDLALCVDDTPCRYTGSRWLVRNRVYRVVSADRHGLCLEGDESRGVCWCGHIAGWREERFSKVKPDRKEACEPEFVTLLNRTKVSA
jgi:hypothetical protein